MRLCKRREEWIEAVPDEELADGLAATLATRWDRLCLIRYPSAYELPP